MTDLRTDILLVERLQMLRVESRVTIAEMAEKCGLPKSSLESYMRLEGARKPGVEALVSIASAFGVSIDWLVGLSEVRPSQDASAHDSAVACMEVVTSLLSRLEDEQAKSGQPIIRDSTFAGVHKTEVAARAMLSFLQTVERMKTSLGAEGVINESTLKGLRRMALEKAVS